MTRSALARSTAMAAAPGRAASSSSFTRAISCCMRSASGPAAAGTTIASGRAARTRLRPAWSNCRRPQTSCASGSAAVFDFTRTAPFDRPWMPNGPAAFQGVDAPWTTCGLPCGSTATSPAARPIERSGAVRWRVQLPSVTMWNGAQAWGSAACSEAHCAPKRQMYCTSGRTRSRGAKPLRVSDARGSAMWRLFKGWMIPCGTSLSRAGISVVAGQP